MFIGLRITGIATLLIGSQLLIPIEFYPQVELHFSNNILSKQIVIAYNEKGSQGLDQIAQTSSGFFPQDNGGPDYTRGSGTR